MKHTTYYLPLLFAACLACGEKKDSTADSKKEADNANEQTHEAADIDKDLDFATTAAAGGMFEVNLGKLAQQQASIQEVKAFGQSMAADHGMANQELKGLAATKTITLPDTLTDDQQKKYKELAEKTGAEFDKAYINLMVDEHEKDVKLFEKEAENGEDADLKSWASGKVATLQHHLEMAKKAQETLDNKR